MSSIVIDGHQASGVTPEGIFSYPSVFSRTKFKLDADRHPDGLYRLTLVFPDKSVLQEMRTVAKKLIVAKWPDPTKREEALANPKFNNPFRSCKEKLSKKGFEHPNGMFIAFRSDRELDVRKAVRDTSKPVGPNGKHPWMEATTEDIMAGYWGRVKFSMFAYTEGNGGVSLWMNSVMMTKVDEVIAGGKSNADEDFDDIEESEALTADIGDDSDWDSEPF